MLDRTKAPAVHPFGPLTIPGENVVTLSNGIVLHSYTGGDQDVIRLRLVIDGGPSDCDSPNVATFAAELMREGCATHDSEAIADLIDYCGAWFNSSAAGHYTSLQLSSLTSKFERLAPMTIECLVHPTFPDDAFEIIRAKGVAQQRLNLSRVSFLAGADNRRMMTGDHHPESIIPAPEEIEAIQRESLIDFHRRILDSRRIHAYLCGRFSAVLHDNLCRLLETIPAAGSPSPVEIIPYAPLPPSTSTIARPGSLQSAVAMSIPAIPRSHPDYNALRMAVTALGGYFGSRLMMNIREDKGYTYGISSALLGSREGSYVSISAQCDNRYTSALIDEVRAELRRMADEPLSADEIHKLKFNVASDLASTLDSPMSIMDYYELQRTVGTPADYFYARQETVKHITPEIICDLSKTYLNPDNLRISIAGDL